MIPFEKIINKICTLWVFALFVLFLVVSYQWIDRSLAWYFFHLDLRTHQSWLNLLTALGQKSIYIASFVFFILYWRYIQKNKVYEFRAFYLLGCVFIPNLLGLIIKVFLSRARPELLFSDSLYGFYWFQLENSYWSMPSGHAITIAALASGLSVLFPRYIYAFFSVALLVALSRVLLYRHYLSDVMLGFYLSVFIVGVFTLLMRRKHPSRDREEAEF